jgi:hypothetical protein
VRVISNVRAAVILRVPAKGIKHQEWVKPALHALRQYPFELDTRIAARTPPGNQLLNTARLADRDVLKGHSHDGFKGNTAGQKRRPWELPGEG